jgi:hypothetical protein
MDAVTQLAPTVGIVAACDFLAVPRASFYRQRPVLGPPASPAPAPATPAERSAPARSLSEAERAGVLAVLHEARFQDRSPAAVQATLLDEGQYLCSIRTMYRILQQEGESGERRDQLVHPAYQKPELLATAPNQLWSWDITKLRGPVKWTYFYLYVIIDVFSRYVTGWMIAYREGAELARQFIEEAIGKHQVPAGQLTIHADRGRVMKSKPALCFRRQPVFGKPVPNHEVPPGISRSFRLHPRQPHLLPAILPVVQRRAPPFRHRLTHPCRGSFRRNPNRPGPSSGGARCRLSCAPGPLRPATTQTDAIAVGGLDQQAGAVR